MAIARLYPDDKTFVDKVRFAVFFSSDTDDFVKPTSKPPQEVLNDFRNISTGTTYGQISNFLQTDFVGEGLELEAVALTEFNPSPSFLTNVSLPLPRAFAQTVHGIWTQLIRGTNTSTLCGSSGKCESTLIPLNHTFVVPGPFCPLFLVLRLTIYSGGRFREQYYWDSFWILEGLIESQLFGIANDTLQNFMDELDNFGFIPNGGRIYCQSDMTRRRGFLLMMPSIDLNRSQPPVFIQVS